MPHRPHRWLGELTHTTKTDLAADMTWDELHAVITDCLLTRVLEQDKAPDLDALPMHLMRDPVTGIADRIVAPVVLALHKYC